MHCLKKTQKDAKSRFYSLLLCINAVCTSLRHVQKVVHRTYFVKPTRKTKRAERKKASCTAKSRTPNQWGEGLGKVENDDEPTVCDVDAVLVFVHFLFYIIIIVFSF
jgi:hypothetical protein